MDGIRPSQNDYRSPPPAIRVHAKDERSDGPWSTGLTFHNFEDYLWILGLKNFGEDLDRHRAEEAVLSDLAPFGGVLCSLLCSNTYQIEQYLANVQNLLNGSSGPVDKVDGALYSRSDLVTNFN